MEDSSMFMQWALSTLQHEHHASDDGPELGYSAPSVSSMVPGDPPAREDRWTTASSWSSGDTDSSGGSVVPALKRDGWWPSQNSTVYAAAARSTGGATNQPVSWNFGSASAWPSKESMGNSGSAAVARDCGALPQPTAHESPLTRRTTARSSGVSRSSAPPYVQHHIMAERKRREKINQRFIELSSVIPGLKKMDKATILSDATRYVKELQGKLKAHEDGGCRKGRRNMDSAVLAEKKPRIVTVPDGEDGGGSPSDVASVTTSATRRGTVPEIEVKISKGNVMVRIHCEYVRGVLVRLLAEVEELHLSIVHANAMPFPASSVIINIMAKVEEGFNNTTADDIVGQLSCVLDQHI